MLLCCKQQAGSPGVPDPMPCWEYGFPGQLWQGWPPGGGLAEARCHAPRASADTKRPAHTQRKVAKEGRRSERDRDRQR